MELSRLVELLSWYDAVYGLVSQPANPHASSARKFVLPSLTSASRGGPATWIDIKICFSVDGNTFTSFTYIKTLNTRLSSPSLRYPIIPAHLHLVDRI